jgi:hypothetical protein
VAKKKVEILTQEDRELLSRHFQIAPDILKEAGVRRITHKEAQNFGFYKKDADAPFDGILFPYLDTQDLFNARLRRDVYEKKDDGSPDGKYLMLPSNRSLRRGLYMMPTDRQRLESLQNGKRGGVRVVMMEAEKSALAATSWARRAKRKDIIFVATGGCNSYNTPDLELLRGLKVDVLLDSNVWEPSRRPERAESTIVSLLNREYGADAGALRLPRDSRAEGINGPDDFLAEKKDGAFARLIDGPRAEPWLARVGVPWDVYNNTTPPRMAIEGFLQEEGVTLLGALPSGMKTWVMLSMVKALLTGQNAFNHEHFPVPCVAERVIYLTPEVSRSWFKQRLEQIELGEYIKSQRLLIRTLSETRIELTDPDLLLAARGAYVFLDTVVRFTKGAENENKDNDAGLAAGCFALLAAGARAVVGAHHARKDSINDKMTLENMLRGAGDIGAFVRTVYGLKKISRPDDISSARVLVECLKPADFNPPEPFTLEGRPYINNHEGMVMVEKKLGDRELSELRKGGRPETPDKGKKVKWLQDIIPALEKSGKEPTYALLAEEMNKTFKSNHNADTVARWLKEKREERKAIAQAAAAAASKK